MKKILTTLNSKYIHTSLALRYLKAYSETKGIKKLYISEYTINQNSGYVLGELYREKPEILAFSTYIWNIEQTIEIIKSLKKVLPKTKIILGGPEVSFDSRDILEKHKEIDFIIRGEGEQTFYELINSIENNTSFESIKGLTYRKKDEISENIDRIGNIDMDDIPPVYTEKLEEFQNKIIYYESSRGCPFNCKFCLSSTIDGVKFLSIDRVKKDLKLFLSNKVKQVKFIDRTFNANKKHAIEILNYINDNDNGITNFHFEITAHTLDNDLLNILSKLNNGLVQFEIGVQSTNQETINSVARRTDFEKLSYNVKRIKDLKNIHIHLDLIGGLPYENYISFGKSFNDVYALKPEKLQLGFLKLLKGSKLRKEENLHGYKYNENAPYEILENKYISYEDILRLKDIEEILENYGNEYIYKNILKYVFVKYDNDYFKFFEEFSKYWRDKRYFDRSHNKKRQLEILKEFLCGKYLNEKELINNLLTFDYIKDNKSPNIPKFLEKEELGRKIKSNILNSRTLRKNYFNEYSDKEFRELHKKTYIEKFEYDILSSNHFKREDKIYMFIYGENSRNIEKSKIFDITEEIDKYYE